MKKNKFTLFCLLVCCLCCLGGSLLAIPDVLIDLRLYEGARETETAKPSVVTSYYLKPLASANTILETDLSGEKDELLKIFNLDSIQLLSQAKWAWKKGVTEKQFQLVVLGGHRFIVQATLMEKSDQFKLEVFEEATQKADAAAKQSLETVIVVPQGKTSVFGFEDSGGKPYFLSFQSCAEDSSARTEDPAVAVEKKPKLLKKVTPVYPEEAVKAKVEGQVIAEVVSDIYGKVDKIAKVEGHPLLVQATTEALKQWVYEPFILKGKPRAVRFTVVVNYSLKEKDKEGSKTEKPVVIPAEGTVNKPVLVKKVAPVYPEEAKSKKIEGAVIIKAVIDLQGNIKSVTKVSGDPLLAAAAVAAVEQWKYQPFSVDNKPKEVEFTVTLNFKLDGKKDK